MAAVRTAMKTKGLSPADLEQIRDSLAVGRKPKVIFTESAGQIAGQVGQVVALTDPQLSDEWVTVRFGRDELPFSPTDLLVASKATSSRRGGSPAPSPRAEAPAPPLAPAPADTPPPAVTDVSRPTVERAAQETARPATERVTQAEPPAAAATVGVSKPAAARKAGRTKAPASLTVTLAYGEGQWTVAATQGNRPLAKPYGIRAAEALKIVALMDVPGVREAVEEIVTAARAEAERQAERLRTELAEVESRLAELRSGA